MRYSVTIRSDAQRDIASVALWYERQQPGIGNCFLVCVDAALEAVKRSPLGYRKSHGEFRRILVRKFLVGIFYLIHREQVVVAAVIDLRRNPAAIEERLR